MIGKISSKDLGLFSRDVVVIFSSPVLMEPWHIWMRHFCGLRLVAAVDDDVPNLISHELKTGIL